MPNACAVFRCRRNGAPPPQCLSNWAPISFPLPDTPGRPESPPDRALLVIDRNGGQTSKPGARRPLESTARDSAPSCPQSCVVEVVSSSKAPLRNRICWNQQLHRFAASFLCKEDQRRV